MESVIMEQVTAGALLAFVLEWAKRSSWIPWLQGHQKRAHFLLSGALALASSVGISYAWDPAVDGRLIVEGLSWATIGPAAWEWIKQWAIQQGVYQGVIQRSQVRAKEVVVIERGAQLDDVRRRVTAALEAAYQDPASASGPDGGVS